MPRKPGRGPLITDIGYGIACGIVIGLVEIWLASPSLAVLPASLVSGVVFGVLFFGVGHFLPPLPTVLEFVFFALAGAGAGYAWHLVHRSAHGPAVPIALGAALAVAVTYIDSRVVTAGR